MDVFYELIEVKTKKLIGRYFDLEEAIKDRKVTEYVHKVDEKDNLTMQERMIGLNNYLKSCSEYYYKYNVSKIDDGTYDKLMKRLEEWERKYPQFEDKDSMTHKVGSSL